MMLLDSSQFIPVSQTFAELRRHREVLKREENKSWRWTLGGMRPVEIETNQFHKFNMFKGVQSS